MYKRQVQIDAHVSGIGWQGWDTPSASEGGTTGQGRAVEAVRLRLTGSLARDYDVYYRVHASNIGWMAWAKDGEEAGTTGMAYSLEASQIKLIKKGRFSSCVSVNLFFTSFAKQARRLRKGGFTGCANVFSPIPVTARRGRPSAGPSACRTCRLS